MTRTEGLGSITLPIVEQPDREDMEQMIVDKENIEEFRKYLEVLDERARLIMELIYFYDLNYRSIGKRLEISAKLVKSIEEEVLENYRKKIGVVTEKKVDVKERPIKTRLEEKKQVSNWNRNDLSYYLVELTSKQERLDKDDFPQRINPAPIWRDMTKMLKFNYPWNRLREKILITGRNEINFSPIMSETDYPLGYGDKSLWIHDGKNRGALPVVGDIRFQPDKLADKVLNRKSYLSIESLYQFLTDIYNPAMRVVKTSQGNFWIFASRETENRKKGDFQDGESTFRDRWLNVTGVEKKGMEDNVFSSNGVPWSNTDTEIWKHSAKSICEYYKLVVYRESADGHLEKELG